MSRLLLALAGLAVIGALACRQRSPHADAGAAPQAAAPQAAAPEGPDPAALAALVRQLLSADEGEWREAALHLAHAGEPGLAALARTADVEKPALAPRVKVVVGLALLKTVDAAALPPSLRAVVAAPLQAAQDRAASLSGIKFFDSGEHGLRPPNAPPLPLSAQEAAVVALADMGGFAVPALVTLLRGSNPFARAHAAGLLCRLEATAALADLERASKDAVTVDVFHGCSTAQEPVGSFARCAVEMRAAQDRATPAQAARAHPDSPVTYAQIARARVARDVESYLLALEGGGPQLIGGIRRSSSAYDAQTWDEYWQEARVAWRLWWAPESLALSPQDRAAALAHRLPRRTSDAKRNTLLFPPEVCLELVPPRGPRADAVLTCLGGLGPELLPAFEREVYDCLKDRQGPTCLPPLAQRTRNRKLCLMLPDASPEQAACLGALK